MDGDKLETPTPHTALLVAVRDTIRRELKYRNEDCEIEHGDLVPAAAGQTYVIVMPAGCRSGDTYDSTHGQTYDAIYAVDVKIILRSAAVPRNRLKDKWLWYATSLEQRAHEIKLALSPATGSTVATYWDLMTLATEIMGSTTLQFVERLRWIGQSRQPTLVGSEMFAAATNENQAGMALTVNFDGARVASC